MEKFDAAISDISTRMRTNTVVKSSRDPKNNRSKVQSIESDLCLAIRDAVTENEKFKVGESYSPYVYNGVYFEELDKGRFEYLCQQILEDLNVGSVYKANSYKKCAELSVSKLREDKDSLFIPDRGYACFRNGVLNIKTQEFKSYGGGDVPNTDIILDIDYDISAKSLLWEKFLDRVLPDKRIRDILQEFVGACLIDRRKVKIESACYCIGGGRNGKSVFLNTIGKVIGAENHSVFSPDELFRSSNQALCMHGCNGKLVNIVADVSKNDISCGEYRRFVSGEPFPARALYGKHYSATRIPLLLMGLNDMPITTDDSLGHTRRMLVIPFNQTISEEEVDTSLEAKLSTDDERAGIINWILDGTDRFWNKNNGKFSSYGVLDKIKREYEMDSNSVLRWLSDREYCAIPERYKFLEAASAHAFLSSEMFNDYKEFCKECGYSAFSVSKFGRTLFHQGFKKVRRGQGNFYFVMTIRELAEIDLKFSEYTEAEQQAFIEKYTFRDKVFYNDKTDDMPF